MLTSYFLAILLTINKYNYCSMNTKSHNWNNNFRKFFTNYSGNGTNSKILTLLHYDSYVLSYNLVTLVFKKISNYNNFAPSYILKSLDSKSCFIKKSPILSLQENLFTRLFNLNL